MAIWTDVGFNPNSTDPSKAMKNYVREVNNKIRYHLANLDLGSTGDLTVNTLTASSAEIGQIGSTGSITANTLTASSATFGKISASSAKIAQLSSTGSITANIISSSSAIIPYISSTASLSVQKIAFDITPTTEALNEGEIRWNDSDKTINVQTENEHVTLQVGQEMYIRATNKTTSDLTNGQVVYINGAQGNRPTINLAIASTSFYGFDCIGVVTHDIPKNNTGYVSTFGLVRDIDTSAFTEGDLLYVSSTNAGTLVNTEPAEPNLKIAIGYVVTSSTAGVILLHIDNGETLQHLHDVYVTSPVTNNVITYSSSSRFWTNTDSLILSTISSSSGNFTVLHSASATFGNSTSYSKFEDDGTLVFEGDATVWEDSNFNSVAAAIGVSAPDLINFSTTLIKIASFDGVATNEELSVSQETPHKYKEGTDIVAHVHYCGTNSSAGDVRFYFDYAIVSSSGVVTSGTFDVTTTISAGSQWQEKRLDLGTISGTGLKMGQQGLFRLYRIPGSSGDTYGDDVGIFTFGYHHQIDTAGSRQITTK